MICLFYILPVLSPQQISSCFLRLLANITVCVGRCMVVLTHLLGFKILGQRNIQMSTHGTVTKARCPFTFIFHQQGWTATKISMLETQNLHPGPKGHIYTDSSSTWMPPIFHHNKAQRFQGVWNKDFFTWRNVKLAGHTLPLRTWEGPLLPSADTWI